MTSCGARDGLVTFDPAKQMRVIPHASRPNRGCPFRKRGRGCGRAREVKRASRERRSFVMGSDVFEAEEDSRHDGGLLRGAGARRSNEITISARPLD